MPAALTTIKILGLIGAASYALARLTVLLGVISWHRAIVIAVPQDRMPAMPRGFTVREVDAAELARWTIDVTPEQQAARFVQGITCLGAFNRDAILTGVVWVTATGCSEGDVALLTNPAADGAWDTGMWIHPEHRLGRTFQALWAGVGAWLGARGLNASYSAIADYNINSLRSHRRLGMVRVSKITALRIGRWQWIAAGSQPWRMVRPGNRIEWQVLPIAAGTPIALAPSLAG